MELHVGRPNIGSRELLHQLLDEILDSRVLTNNGPFVEILEGLVCDLTGAKHAIAVSNATRGLEIACRALNMEREVLVPSFTFVATPNALHWQRCRPVFVDTSPGKFTISPEEVERTLGMVRRVSGIVATHTFGQLCQVDKLQSISDAYNIPVVYDAAHCLGVPGVGTNGNAEVFSLHATKIANSFEGGVITTNDDDLAYTCRLMRNYGFTGYGETATYGINAKMSDVHAAMGVVSLSNLDDFIDWNKWVYGQYKMRLRDMIVDGEDGNYHYVVAMVDDAEGLAAHLHKRGVLVRRYFHPGCHNLIPYLGMYPSLSLPNTEELCRKVVCLPTGTSINEEDIERVCLEIEAYYG